MMDYQWCDEARPVEKTNMLERLRNSSRAGYNGIVKWAMDNGIIMPAYFAYPWKFFWADGAYLKCLGSGLKLKCDSYMNWDTEIQGMINRYYPQWWHDLTSCDALRIIFEYLKTIKLTPYYKALLRFKWETGLLEFPMFGQKNMIEVIDGKLVGFVCSQGTKGWEKRLLTDEAVTAEIKRCGGSECKDNYIKRKLASGLLKLHEQENTPENSTKKFEVMFDWGNVSYLPIVGQLDIKYGKEGWPWYTPPQKPVLSEDGRESLRVLSSGELSRLDDIAELVARLYMPELPSEYMWVVCGEKTGIHQFCQWILTLTNGRWGNAAYIKGEEERNKQLAEDQVLGCPCQINDSFISVDKFKKINHSMLQKFAAGEVVGTLKDPYQKEQNILGESVLICAAETIDGIDLGKLKHKIVQIPKGWTCRALQENGNNIWVAELSVMPWASGYGRPGNKGTKCANDFG